jgi:hypothetical protein
LGSATFAFIADPFRVAAAGAEYVFVEAWNMDEARGQIAALKLSNGGVRSADIVLAPAFHLSYPCVFAHEGNFYMLPEAWETGALLLYKARHFPWSWEVCRVLLELDYADPQIHFDGKIWYIFLNIDPLENSTCCLYWAESPIGPWRPHPANPIVAGDPRRARSAGPLVAAQGRLLRFTQDCSAIYGGGIQVSQITRLSPTHFSQVPLGPLEVENPAWAVTAVHHIHTFREGRHNLALFDGYSTAGGEVQK